jgi:glycosyltransferase involved in cell wall biosynthesis
VGGVRDLMGEQLNLEHVEGLPFKVYQRGILVNSGDAIGLSRAISYLMENRQLRQQMGESGRNFVAQKYTKDRLVKDVENLYEKILIK